MSDLPRYGVAAGRGIHYSWEECKTQTSGFQNLKFKKFPTRKEAEEVPINISKDVSEKMEGNDCSSTVDSNTVGQKDFKDKITVKSENYLLGVTVKKEPSTAPVKSEEESSEEESDETSQCTTPPGLKESVHPNFRSNEVLKNQKENIDVMSLTVGEVCHMLKKKKLVLKETGEQSIESVTVDNNEHSSDSAQVPEKKSKEKKIIVNELKKGKKKKKVNNNIQEQTVDSLRVENNEKHPHFKVPKKTGKQMKNAIEKLKGKKEKKVNNNVQVNHATIENNENPSDFKVPKKKSKQKKNSTEELKKGKKANKKRKKEANNNNVQVNHARIDNNEKPSDSVKVPKKKNNEKKKRKKVNSNFPVENEEANHVLRQDQISSQAINNHLDVKALVLTTIENLLANRVLLPQMLQGDLSTQVQPTNLTQEKAAQPGPSTSGLSNSVCTSVSNNVKNDLKNVELEALNLKLVSLETRLQDCVSQISGISSELRYLRGENKATLTEHAAQLSELNGHATNVSTDVKSFKHEPMTQQSTLNKSSNCTQPVQPEQLPGASSSSEEEIFQEINRRKRIKLESDDKLAQPLSQESSSKEMDSTLESISSEDEWLEPEGPDFH